MHTPRVSSKGQIVIPKDVRKRHRLDRDKDLVLLEEGDALILRKKANVEKVLKDRFYPLIRASAEGLAQLWENSEDDVWNDA